MGIHTLLGRFARVWCLSHMAGIAAQAGCVTGCDLSVWLAWASLQHGGLSKVIFCSSQLPQHEAIGQASCDTALGVKQCHFCCVL